MKILLTGATGYIGSVVAEKLVTAGHDVIGLSRSDAASRTMAKQQIKPYRGELGDPNTLLPALKTVDGVIHTAFDMSSGDFAKANAGETKVVETLVSGLTERGQFLILTSGTGVLGNTGELIYEEETPIARADSSAVEALQLRLGVERTVLSAPGLRGVVLRPPNVYGRSDGRMVIWALRTAARKLGGVPYATNSEDNLWSFVHVDDLADLFVLAVEKAPGGELFHAGAQSGLRTQDIATAISHGMGLGGATVALTKSDLAHALGSQALADYWASNSQSSCRKACTKLGWDPRHLDFLYDLSRST
jgi:nucleoside-diphosphate-sugar epimerase